jgi:5'-methylthioadenosine phosphorylase
MSTTKPILGVIGGSGLYNMADLEDVETVTIETPFGAPSDDLIIGTLKGTRAAFLPRHGRGHRFTPSEVNYRANIWALKKLGCEFIVSVSAVGSMKEAIEPGHLVIIDQLIDRTVGRDRTFFGDGVVGHVGFGDPICPTFRKLLLECARKTDAEVVNGGTYICIEGPTFSTRAESELFRSWGVSVIGMTNLPEARLAREAGMSYATIALATDYDCWHESEEDVSVEAVVATLKQNVSRAQAVIKHVAEALAEDGALQKSPYADVAATAIMTDKATMPYEQKRALAALYREYLG